MSQPTRILFVCLGNIVRSPLAENMFAHVAQQAGLADQFEVDSAGTGSWHVGDAPDSRMREVAAQRGFSYSGSARQFSAADYGRFDLVIGMDSNNKQDMLRQARSEADRVKVHLLRKWDPEGGPNDPVPDPYYGGIEGFELAYDLVERSCQGLLAWLQAPQDAD
jgi:protein-tyrosine phosphatase